jgi:hypothetical protein
VLGPENLVSKTVGNVHQLWGVERYAPRSVEVKVGVVFCDNRVFHYGFAQFLRRIGPASDYGIRENSALGAGS